MRGLMHSKSRRRLFRVLLVVTLFPILFFGTLYALVHFETIDDLPSKRELKRYQNPLASKIYAAEGQEFGKYYIENRSALKYQDLNEDFKKALIATEDRRFYYHSGVDARGLMRVFFKTLLLQKESSGGGSTITQQLAKNLYPRKKYKFFGVIINKFREMVIAQRIEQVYKKKEILLLYANTVSFGERAFGLATASDRFYNKPANDLTLDEAATLVGMLKATTYYSPRKNPENAIARRNTVLRQMKKYKFISEEVRMQTSSLPITLDYQPERPNAELARYFKEHVRKEFENWSKANPKKDGSTYDVYTDGLKVYTTLDFDLQQAAEVSMKKHMKNLQRQFDANWRGGRKFGSGTKMIDERILADPVYKELKSKGKNKSERLTAFTTNEERIIWTWDGYQPKDVTKIDSIKHYLGMLHSGILATDPNTGAIKVWVGGNDYGQFQYDNVKRPRHVGSLFKPIAYLAALEKGVSPCDYYANERQTYKAYKNWSPRNSNNEYGGYLPVKEALARSVNTVSVQVLFEAGIPDVITTARELGIDRELSEVPSIVLGTSDVSLYEMVRAYSVLANGGTRRPLRAIQRIEDKNGKVLFQAPPNGFKGQQSSLSYANINMLNGMLQQVTTRGTAQRLRNSYDIPFHVMGKTGTTQNQTDGWFIGFTDQLVVGAWVGAEDRRIHHRTLSTGAGGRSALPLVGPIFEKAGKKGIHPLKWNTDAYFDCYDYLTEEQYNFLASRRDYERELPENVEELQETIDRYKRKEEIQDKRLAYEQIRADRKKKREQRKLERKLKKRQKRK